jgi:cell division protein FtsQ
MKSSVLTASINWPFWLALAFFVVTLGAVVMTLIKMNGPITAVHVVGNLSAAEQQEVREAVTRRLDRGVLHVRLDELVADVMALAWPREVHVRRVWPGRLEVGVAKEAVAARWGTTGAVTTSGEIIPADTVATERLPLLEAVYSDGARAMLIYQRLRAVLARTDLDIVALREDVLAEWNLTLNNGLTLALGREQMPQRLERFLIVYERVEDKLDAVEGIDARYTNGVAVRWREGYQPNQAGSRQVATAPR